MLMRASLVTSPLLTHLQSINIDSINWLNHLINSDMKLTADHPAGGSVNMCTWTAPSLTSSLLNLSISPYCISPDRQRIALVSWIYYTVNILSEGKHIQELMVESCANTELPPDEDFCQNIGCVCVCVTVKVITFLYYCQRTTLNITACASTVGTFIAAFSLAAHHNHATITL